METVTKEFVEKMIDFAPSKEQREMGYAEIQTEGTAALYNMLVRNQCAYLADEVGMGKTYVALGVMSLLRHFNPHAKIMVITPRENIQRKWIKELENFVRFNWKSVDNRIKSIQGRPAWEPVYCNSLFDFVHEVLLDSNRDFFLRMPSFSFRLKDPESQKKIKTEICKHIRWVDRHSLKVSEKNYQGFRDSFGGILNAVIPEIDLIVVDEAHKLKHGFGKNVSTRNRIMGLAFGHPTGHDMEFEWFKKKAKHVLFLSATPFEEEYSAIQHQFDIFGFGDAKFWTLDNHERLKMRDLLDKEVKESSKRQILNQFMIRRVSGLRIGGEKYTKNMYRREWRSGGYTIHDSPMEIDDTKQRLIVALMQKKVAEILQDQRFNNSFQIGMMSSFESFLESVGTTAKRRRENKNNDDSDGSDFYGEEQNTIATKEERHGIDTTIISKVVESYHQHFGERLPHPKLDATAKSLEDSFFTGDKTLVFVRRVATVYELAMKLDRSFDNWIKLRMERGIPALKNELGKIFNRYERERRNLPVEQMEEYSGQGDSEDLESGMEGRFYMDEDDEGSTETFFSWFFRGKGPAGILSGAAFQKNRLANTSAVHSTLFEDDYVSWLLERPSNVMKSLSDLTNTPLKSLTAKLRNAAYGNFRNLSRQKKGYSRLYVYEAYQMAALELIKDVGNAIGKKASIIVNERYIEGYLDHETAPHGFPGPDEMIGISTFFTELVKVPELRRRIWPDEIFDDFRQGFRRREQRRELISALSRLGASFIDLYILAIKSIGSFSSGRQSYPDRSDYNLAKGFVRLLEKQMSDNKFNAFYELSNSSKAFDLILTMNFPSVHSSCLIDLPTIYSATLKKQVPVGRMSGEVNRQMVRQFRMPGFPLVLVTTDVLQEGEDLHTFCKNVIHYGIAWMPSAIEQRTGRVDRIGSLVQRRYDGVKKPPSDDKFIQVHYPHLRDTVEVLQVRRVLQRLNRFLTLIHKSGQGTEDIDSRINMAEEILDELVEIPPIKGVLKSAFPVQKGWLNGELKGSDAVVTDYVKEYGGCFDRLWKQLIDMALIMETCEQTDPRLKEGSVNIINDESASIQEEDTDCNSKHFRLELKSQISGEATLLRCESEVGYLNLRNDKVIDRLYKLQADLGQIKICVRPEVKRHLDYVTIKGDILFHPGTTQIEEVATLVQRTVETAATIECELDDILIK